MVYIARFHNSPSDLDLPSYGNTSATELSYFSEPSVFSLAASKLKNSYSGLPLNNINSNSCYVDDSFELVTKCMIPYVKSSFVAASNPSNPFNLTLLNAFGQYEQRKTEVGKQLVRNFAWRKDPPFTKGNEDDALHSFEKLLEGTSY